MARPKKTTTKKTTSTRGRKPATKATAKTSSVNSPAGDAVIKMLKHSVAENGASSAKPLQSPSIKRLPNNPDMPQHIIKMLNDDFNSIKELLDNFSQHLRSLDRRRLNGVGVRKLGFIRRTERGRGRACTDMTERVRTRRA